MQRHPLTLDALFSRSVAEHGDAVAVQDRAGRWTYARLDAQAEALARELEEGGAGAGPGGEDTLVIHAERTVHAVVAILAAARIGAAFVPVGLDTPRARLARILDDAGARLLLVDSDGEERVAGGAFAVPVVVVDRPRQPAWSRRLRPEVREDALAYIIYTSGTTGEPKGVMIEHGSIARRSDDFDRRYELAGRSCRVLQLARFGFDVFLGDLVKALGSGGTLVLSPDEAALDPAQLHRWLTAEAIDYVEVVPAVLRNLVEHLEAAGEALPALRILNCGADLFTKEEYERSRRVTRAARLFNSYGVTECTVESTSFEDDGTVLATKETLPIGRALASDEILIVDQDLEPVGTGTVGQIVIGGPCVARGYRGRPDLDARAFFVRTGRDGEPTRFYRTGDRGRIDAAGNVEFLGRLDFQLKIDGHRIEPGEIEAVLERLPEIDRAVACVTTADSLLTAFVLTTTGALDRKSVLAHAARHLPGFMVPRRVVRVERFPLTGNGKVDRRALAEERPAEREVRAAERWPELEAVEDVEELEGLALAQKDRSGRRGA